MTDQDQFEKAYAHALGGHIAPVHIRMQRAPSGAKEDYSDRYIDAAYTGWKLGIEAAAKEAEHWQEVTRRAGGKSVAGEYIAAAIRGHVGKPREADPDDFPLGKACDLSGEGNCEACQ